MFNQIMETFFATDFESLKAGPDLSGLRRLTPSERNRAEEIFLKALPSQDPRIARGLCIVASQASLLALLEYLPLTNGLFELILRRAIWNLNQDDTLLHRICEVLNRSLENISFDALYTLAGIRRKFVIETLQAHLGASEYLVLYHVATVLIDCIYRQTLGIPQSEIERLPASLGGDRRESTVRLLNEACFQTLQLLQDKKPTE